MGAIEEVDDAEKKVAAAAPLPSQERLRDAEEIEKLVSQLQRPTAKMQIESLVKKLKKESSALEAIEKSGAGADLLAKAKAEEASEKGETKAPPVPAPAPPPPVPITYTTLDKFAFDAGGSSDKFVTLYLPLPEVGSKIPKDDRKKRIKSVFGKFVRRHRHGPEREELSRQTRQPRARHRSGPIE